MSDVPQKNIRSTLRRLIAGQRMTQALGVAAQLAIADLLADGPRTSDEIARLRGCNPDALYRVMRLLASEGVFAELAGRRFALTPLSELLQTAWDGSLRALALIEAREWSVAWSELAFSVATGEPAFPRVFGAAQAEYYRRHPPALALYDEAVATAAGDAGRALAAGYDFSGLRALVVPGAGAAPLLVELLQAAPELSAIVVDVSGPLGRAEARFKAAGVAGRVQLVRGDPASPPPRGGDAYLPYALLGDCGEAGAVAMLRNCRAAMAARGRILAVEPLMTGEGAAAWEDVERLVMRGGYVRTEAEFRALFAAAGLTLTRALPAAEWSVIEGR